MAYFDESGVILGQLSGHYNMFEIYAHLYASFFLFFASLIAVVIVYYTLKKSVYSWPAILGGLLYVGLIGLGEGLEHLPFFDPFIHSMAHYLHLFSAPIAVFTLYLGMQETVAMCKGEPLNLKVHSTEIGMGVFAAFSIGVISMAMLAHTPWNERIEGPFLLAIFLPTVFFVALVFWESRHFAESIEMLYLPILSIAVSFLALDIWLGRFADVKGFAGLYILTHSFQDTILAVTGAVVILFALNVWYSHRIGRLFVCGVSSREEMKEKRPSPAETKKFRVDEQ
ncbi:MAG: hypothetical protein ACE5HH_00330 [Candidatus Hydrothermarchaeales archaeon]